MYVIDDQQPLGCRAFATRQGQDVRVRITRRGNPAARGGEHHGWTSGSVVITSFLYPLASPPPPFFERRGGQEAREKLFNGCPQNKHSGKGKKGKGKKIAEDSCIFILGVTEGPPFPVHPGLQTHFSLAVAIVSATCCGTQTFFFLSGVYPHC